MSDKNTCKWLYQNAKNQMKVLIFLVFGNALFSVSGVLFALCSRNVIDGAETNGIGGLARNAIGLLLIMILQLLLRVVCRYMSQRMNAKLEMNLKTRVLNQVMQKDYAHITAYHSGELMNRLTSDVTVISGGLTSILPALTGMSTRLLAVFWVLCSLDLMFAAAFIAGGVILLLLTKSFRSVMKRLHKKVQESEGKVRSFMQEILENILVVKIFNVEEKMCQNAVSLQEDNFHFKMKRTKISSVSNAGISFVFSLGYLYALVWSSFGMIMKTVSFGTVTAILQLVGQIQSPISGLSGLMPQFYTVLASAERLMELERMPMEEEKNAGSFDPGSLYEDMESIRFSGVSFRYDRDYVLKKASFAIEKGDFIVIGGISGIGKSTLLKLLLGVYMPDEGSICLYLSGGKTIETDRHVRAMFSYVPQGNLLLSGTIKDNIKFVSGKASDQEVEEAARLSCAYEFISALPHGFDTVIGEKGSGLSEGQIQRIAIARALLSEAPVLLLDEATSALDGDTEKRLLENIKSLKEKTCIIISHKAAAFQVCNKEIRIEDGVAKIYQG